MPRKNDSDQIIEQIYSIENPDDFVEQLLLELNNYSQCCYGYRLGSWDDINLESVVENIMSETMEKQLEKF